MYSIWSPQESVLGPVLLISHISLSNHNINHHLYADDIHIYISLSPMDTHTRMSTVNDCLTLFLSWMQSNKLKLKTTLIIIGTKQQ